MKSTPETRFLRLVNKTSTCWLWKGTKSPSGYGCFSFNVKRVRAHRWSYEHFIGPIPAEMVVCHSCDVRNCVNPEHLWIGTRTDNHRDMCRKRRHAGHVRGRGSKSIDELKNYRRGSNHGRSRITEDDVLAIRDKLEKGSTLTSLAKSYGIHITSIFLIKHRKTWSHI
jgi:hypothetical protein